MKNANNSNLLFNYDAEGTIPSIDIIKNVDVKSKNKVEKSIKNNFEIQSDINEFAVKFQKKDKIKKEYKTIYIKSDYVKKIKKLAKSTNRSFAEVIELLVEEFEKNELVTL
ncbi:ribbon-helix-helix protein, CopG family [Spiroplasma endosymbiont of Amphimallon solstitiale]|uniref:ribbon-helix-helix protein, CopG family n=1 Tax=Spiroplasma endosymbiont of Amphimallon solstitiale TaxID=3066288 RepID=UPI00313BAD3A